MAEDATKPTEAPKKKKKSKLPILLVLMLLLGGGGFFVLKTKGAKSKTPPKIVMAEKETELEEFLTNTSNSTVYVRAKISIRLSKDYDEAKLKGNMGDVRDAVLLVLNGTSPAQITDATQRTELKKTLAAAINLALVGPPKATPIAKGATPPDDKTKEKKPDAKPADAADRTDDWDSQTGPVMKVRFSSLATQ